MADEGLGNDMARLPFGAGSPAEMAGQPAGIGQVAGGLYSWLGELAKRSLGASEEMRQGGAYDAGPILESAMLPMGTGAIAGVPVKGAEAVLGAGPIRRTPPPDVSAWFGKSRVADKEGNPLVVYRGEHGDPSELAPGQLFQSRTPESLTFSNADAASLYATEPNNWHDVAHSPRVTPGHLRIENPIIEKYDDPFVDLSHLAEKLGPDEARRIAEKFDPYIQNTGRWMENYQGKYDNVPHLLKENPEALNELYFDTYQYLDDAEEVARLKARGYDGAAHIGAGETGTDMEYRIFDPSQFRSSIYGLGGALGGLTLGAGAGGQDNG